MWREAGGSQPSEQRVWGTQREAQTRFAPQAHGAAAHSHLLMRDTQSSAWLRSGELPRLFRFSPSLTRDCSTVLQEAGEGRQGFSEGTVAHGEARQASSKAYGSTEGLKRLGVPPGDGTPTQGSVCPQQLPSQTQPGTAPWPDTGTEEGVGLCQAVGAQGSPRAQEQLTQPLHINSAPLPRAAWRGGGRGWHRAREETVTATGLEDG